MTMWVRTQSNDLVNLANVVSVQKKRVSGADNLHSIVAFDVTEEGAFMLATRITEKQADLVMNTLWRAIPVEDSFDASWFGRVSDEEAGEDA